MKKGFTLLELIVVIVIIGILATLGFAQYTRMIERSRGAEARSVLGAIRTQAAAIWIDLGASNVPPGLPAGAIQNSTLGIGILPGQISNTCTAAAPSTSYYFMYNVPINAAGATTYTATATRCTGAGMGKNPPGPSAGMTLTLFTDFVNGTDTWGGTGGY